MSRDCKDGRRVVVLRSLPLDSDSRTTKMMRAYADAGFPARALAWNRGGTGRPADDIVYYEGQGKIGGKWRNLRHVLAWFLFLARRLVGDRKGYEIIHVIDFDTACIGVPLARLLGKKVVYDGYDHFGSARRNRLARSFFSWLERCLIRASNIAILPSWKRVEQYRIADLDPQVISNIPDDISPTELPDMAVQRDRPLTIAYVGTLEAIHRGLEYLPLLCARYPRIEVVVGGIGQLESLFIDAAKKHANLRFVGKLAYDDALRLMSSADCLYGPYLLTFDHHVYAAPNKMYEHALLGKPLITNSGTPVGDFVLEHETGFLFDGSCEDLERLVGTLDPELCDQVGTRARNLWVERIRFQREQELARFFGQLDGLA